MRRVCQWRDSVSFDGNDYHLEATISAAGAFVRADVDRRFPEVFAKASDFALP